MLQPKGPLKKIKKGICVDATLKFPDYTKPFVIFTDSSLYSLGAVITQVDKNGFYRPIEFAGRSLTDQETRYCITDKELLGVIFGIKKFHHYVDGVHFKVYSDQRAFDGAFESNYFSLIGI